MLHLPWSSARSKIIRIKNLPTDKYNVTDIAKEFEEFGPISSVCIWKTTGALLVHADKRTNLNADVTFENADSAEAVTRSKKLFFRDRTVVVYKLIQCKNQWEKETGSKINIFNVLPFLGLLVLGGSGWYFLY